MRCPKEQASAYLKIYGAVFSAKNYECFIEAAGAASTASSLRAVQSEQGDLSLYNIIHSWIIYDLYGREADFLVAAALKYKC